jgi:hypothetical protein
VEELSASPVEREEVAVMFLRTRLDAEQMKQAWAELERVAGTRGRKFFGALDTTTGEYRVCVAQKGDDDPQALGLEAGTLPGGRYLRARLKGEPPGLYEQIGPAFDVLSSSTQPDQTRPSIEFYRRRDEIDLLLPVAGE